eukprot:1505495-Amphidinium_carterae.2
MAFNSISSGINSSLKCGLGFSRPAPSTRSNERCIGGTPQVPRYACGPLPWSGTMKVAIQAQTDNNGGELPFPLFYARM